MPALAMFIHELVTDTGKDDAVIDRATSRISTFNDAQLSGTMNHWRIEASRAKCSLWRNVNTELADIATGYHKVREAIKREERSKYEADLKAQRFREETQRAEALMKSLTLKRFQAEAFKLAEAEVRDAESQRIVESHSWMVAQQIIAARRQNRWYTGAALAFALMIVSIVLVLPQAVIFSFLFLALSAAAYGYKVGQVKRVFRTEEELQADIVVRQEDLVLKMQQKQDQMLEVRRRREAAEQAERDARKEERRAKRKQAKKELKAQAKQRKREEAQAAAAAAALDPANRAAALLADDAEGEVEDPVVTEPEEEVKGDPREDEPAVDCASSPAPAAPRKMAWDSGGKRRVEPLPPVRASGGGAGALAASPRCSLTVPPKLSAPVSPIHASAPAWIAPGEEECGKARVPCSPRTTRPSVEATQPVPFTLLAPVKLAPVKGPLPMQRRLDADELLSLTAPAPRKETPPPPGDVTFADVEAGSVLGLDQRSVEDTASISTALTPASSLPASSLHFVKGPSSPTTVSDCVLVDFHCDNGAAAEGEDDTGVPTRPRDPGAELV